MKVIFHRDPHPKDISLHYLIGGCIFLFASIVAIIFRDESSNRHILCTSIILLLFLSTFFIVWGSAHLYAAKKGRNFPLWGYAVRKILRSMYTEKGLKNPMLVLPYIDRNGEKYVNFWFSIRFPLHLFPIEIMVKYDNLPKVGKLMDEIASLIAEGKVERIEYEKDENYVPKGIKIVLKDGTVREYKDEVAQDLVFFMSMKRMKYDKVAKQLREIGEAVQKV